MICYLSGKISGLSEDEYKFNFHIAKDKILLRYGVEAYANLINPLDILPLFGIRNWWCYMAADLWVLRKCTHIAVQNNWIDSKGAWIELFLAKFYFKQTIIWL